MPGLHKWLIALALALVAAGVGGIAVHHDPASGQAARGPGSGPASTVAVTTTTTVLAGASSIPVPTVPPGPAPGSAALAAGMITPTDMGGYYRIDPGSATAIVDSAPCLAGLSPSPGQVGRAQTALLGPDLHSLPTIVEVAASYAGQTPASIYREVVAAVDACPSFAVTFGGTPLAVPMKAATIPPVGLADTVWAGTVPYAGTTLAVHVGVVLAGHTVVAMMWIDSVPPSAAIMGDFTSTLSAALGKLA